MPFSKEIKIVHDILTALGFLAKQGHQSLDRAEEVMVKKDNTPVTVYDYIIQALINRFIASTWHFDPIIAEETSEELLSNHAFLEKVMKRVNTIDPKLSQKEFIDLVDYSQNSKPQDRFWVLDPIDGTRGFIQNGQYALAIALIENGQVQLGALACPDFDEGYLIIAEKERGCFSYKEDQKKRLIIQPWPIHESLPYYEPPAQTRHHDHARALELVKKISRTPQPIGLDSQCKYAAVALNLAPLYLRVPKNYGEKVRHEKIWDHAAGQLIVNEAGGKVTDLMSKELDFRLGKELIANVGIVAASPSINESLCKAYLE